METNSRLSELSIEEIKIQQAKNNRIKVQSVYLPERVKDPKKDKGLGYWFNSMPTPVEIWMTCNPRVRNLIYY